MKILRPIVLLLAAFSLMAAPYPQIKDSKAKSTPASAAASASPSSGSQIDINNASTDELKALPGIGEAYSAAIVKNRPYANKRQLVSKKVIPQATFDKISDRIIAKQGKAK